MKRTISIVLFVAAVLGAGVILHAAAPRTDAKKPVLTPVTVAVEGFHCQACPDELQKDLAKLPGVSSVKATLKPAQVTASLDETKMTASAFVAAVAKHPRAMDHSKTYGAKLVAYIDAPMCAKNVKMCPACFTEIPKTLKKVKGISEVKMDATGKIATIGFAKGAQVTTAQVSKALAAHSYKFTTRFTAPAGTKAATSSSQGTCPMEHEGKGSCCGG
ncbi:MAG TPA: heavy-metal-associated domain-containing protein [Armatimonadota bacterium]|jgi:copper chaperone CopZ